MKKEILMTVVFLCFSFYSFAQQGEWIKDKNTGCKIWNSNPAPNETITWTGKCVNGFAHGEGTLQWYKNSVKNGKYEGNYEHGKSNGQATLTYANGDKYSGSWVNGKQHGQGTYTFASGTVWTGDWINNQRTGQGTKTLLNGTIYEGSWVNGKMNGYGTWTCSSGKHKGDTYTGYWKNGKQHGKGTYTWADGDAFKGDFAYGKANRNQLAAHTLTGAYSPNSSSYSSSSSSSSSTKNSSTSSSTNPKVVFKVERKPECSGNQSSYFLNIYEGGKHYKNVTLSSKDGCWYKGCTSSYLSSKTCGMSLEKACEYYYTKTLGKSASSVELEK